MPVVPQEPGEHTTAGEQLQQEEAVQGMQGPQVRLWQHHHQQRLARQRKGSDSGLRLRRGSFPGGCRVTTRKAEE
jgi:hypothetical protein